MVLLVTWIPMSNRPTQTNARTHVRTCVCLFHFQDRKEEIINQELLAAHLIESLYRAVLTHTLRALDVNKARATVPRVALAHFYFTSFKFLSTWLPLPPVIIISHSLSFALSHVSRVRLFLSVRFSLISETPLCDLPAPVLACLSPAAALTLFCQLFALIFKQWLLPPTYLVQEPRDCTPTCSNPCLTAGVHVAVVIACDVVQFAWIYTAVTNFCAGPVTCLYTLVFLLPGFHLTLNIWTNHLTFNAVKHKQLLCRPLVAGLGLNKGNLIWLWIMFVFYSFY